MSEVPRRPLLAVDDEPLSHAQYARALRPYGHAVIVATAAAAREQLAAGVPWEAFFLDLQLSDGSGLDLLAEARERYPRTPALILTGHVDGWVINEAFDRGGEVLGKPFHEPRLHAWIERALRLPASAPPPLPQGDPVLEVVAGLQPLFEERAPGAATRYAIGQHIAAVKAQADQYGDGAVARVAAALREDEATLYRYARVAERWSPQAFAAIAARRMRNGRAPSGAHGVRLASRPSRAASDRALARVLEECMSVRELEAWLADET